MSEQDRRDLVSVEALVRGIKFYSGVKDLGTFVHVTFAREYANTNDHESVLVYIKSSKDILGHLERSVAAGVAKIMDANFPELIIKGYVFCSYMFEHKRINQFYTAGHAFQVESFLWCLITKQITGVINTELQTFYSVYVHSLYEYPTLYLF